MNDDSGSEEIRGLVASFVQMMLHVRSYLEDAEDRARARAIELDSEETQLLGRLKEIALERQDIQELKATCAARLADLEAQRQALIAKMGPAISLLDAGLAGELGVPEAAVPQPAPPALAGFKPPAAAKIMTFTEDRAPRPPRAPKGRSTGRLELKALEHILGDGRRWPLRDLMQRYKELAASPPAELAGLEMPAGGAQSAFIALLRKVPGIKSDGSHLWWL